MTNRTRTQRTPAMPALSAAPAPVHVEPASTMNAAAAPASDAATAGLDCRPARKRRRSLSQTLPGIMGHSDECVERALSGQISSCQCRIRSMDDPAVAVGLALFFARTALTAGLPMPRATLELLNRRVEDGDPACIMVADWLEDSGLLDAASQEGDVAERAP